MAGARAQRVNAGLIKNRAADFLMQGALAETRAIENMFANVNASIRGGRDRKERETARSQADQLARDRLEQQDEQFNTTNTRLEEQFEARESRMEDQFSESQTGVQGRFDAEQERLRESAKNTQINRELAHRRALAKDLYATQVQASKLEADALELMQIRARVASAKNMDPNAKMDILSKLGGKLKSIRGALVNAKAKAGGEDKSDYRSAAVLAAIAEKRVDEREADYARLLQLSKKRPGLDLGADLKAAHDKMILAIADATESKVHAGSLMKRETEKRRAAEKAKTKAEKQTRRNTAAQEVWSFAGRSLPSKVVFDADGNIDGTKSDEETLRKIGEISLAVRRGRSRDAAEREIMSMRDEGPKARSEIADAQKWAEEAKPKAKPILAEGQKFATGNEPMTEPTDEEKLKAVKSTYEKWYGQYGKSTTPEIRNEALAEIKRIVGMK